MSKPIAYAVYISENGDLYYKSLKTEKEIVKIRDGDDLEYNKVVIIKGSDLELEDLS